MKPIKHVLVPTDFSEIAASSYRYALRLAGELSASVHLLHCLPAVPVVPGHGPIVLDMTPQLHQQADERIIAFAEEGKAAVRGQMSRIPEVHATVSVYGLGEGISLYADENEVDLIVAGTHGVQDGWDRLFGTNAAFLVGKVQVPLLILPAKAAFQPLKMVCFATDLRESDLSGASLLTKTLAAFRPKINYLHVHLPDDKQSSGALDLFRRAFEQPRDGAEATFTIVFNRDVTDGIFSYLGKHPHDLLVMVKPVRGWWDRMFVHSDTKESAGITNLPLLILGE